MDVREPVEIVLSLRDEAFQASAQSAQRAFSSLASTVQEGAQRATGAIDSVGQATARMGAGIRAADTPARQMGRTMRDVGGGVSSAAQAMEQTRQASESLSAANVRAATGWRGMVSGASSVVGPLGRVNQAMLAVSATIATLTTLGLPIREAVEFESVMADVKKVMDFPDSEGFARLTQQLKDLSGEIPVPLEGLGRIAEAAGQMGVKAADVGDFVGLVAKMSTAFKLTADEAGTAVGKLMNIFEVSVKGMESFGDAINHLGNNTNATERDIINVLQRVGGMAKVFGLARDQTAALSATFLALGRPPEIAATGINALLSTLQTAPTREADFAKAMRNIGVSAEEMARQIADNPQQALLSFLETLASLDKQTQAETLVKVFGRQYQDDISILLSGLGKYKEILGLVGSRIQYAGSMQQEFTTRLETAKSQIQLAGNALNVLAVNIGNAFLPVVGAVSKALASMATGISAVIEASPTLSSVLIPLAALAGTLRLAMGALSFAGRYLPGLATTMATVASAIAPFSGAIRVAVAGLGALAGAYALLTEARKSSVPNLMAEASAMDKGRTAEMQKLQTLRALREEVLQTKEGTAAHTAAEQKLAEIVPGTNRVIDAQGRILAKASSATDANIQALDRLISSQETAADDALAAQFAATALAVEEATKDLADYSSTVESIPAISAGQDLGWMDTVRAFFGGLPDDFSKITAKGRDLRAFLQGSEAQMKVFAKTAVDAGTSSEKLAEALARADVPVEVRHRVMAAFTEAAGGAQKAGSAVDAYASKLRQISVGLKGPADRTKDILLSAVETADKQLTSLGSKIDQSRQKTKAALAEMGETFRAMASGYEGAYQTRMAGIERYFAAEQNLALRAGVSEREKIRLTTQLMVGEVSQRISAQQKYISASIALVESEYGVKVANARRLGQTVAGIEAEKLSAVRGLLQKQVQEYSAHIDRLIGEERRHLDAARAIQEQRKGLFQTVEEQIFSIQQRSMTEGQKVHAVRMEMDKAMAQGRQALAKGEYEEAKRQADRVRQLAESTAGDSVQSTNEAITRIREAAKLGDEALAGQQKAHEQAASSSRTEYDRLVKAVTSVTNEISRLDKAISVKHSVVFNVDTAKITAATRELDAIIAKKEGLEAVKKSLQEAVTGVAKIPDLARLGDLDSVARNMANVSQAFAAFRKELDGFDPDIGEKFALGDAASKITDLSTRVQAATKEAKELHPEMNKVAASVAAIPPVKLDPGPAVAAAAKIDESVRAIQDRTVYVDVVTRESHAAGGWAGVAAPLRAPLRGYASGGAVRSLLAGGRLPGAPSTRDTVMALLAQGEYVVRAHRARAFAPLLEVINSGSAAAIQRVLAGFADTLPRFAAGGVVTPAYLPHIPTLPTPAPAGGNASFGMPTMRLELSLPGAPPHDPPITLFGELAQVRRLEGALRRANRGRG